MALRKLVIVLLLLVVLGPVLPGHAQDSTPCLPDSGVVITRQIESEAIAQEKSYNVYLPPTGAAWKTCRCWSCCTVCTATIRIG